MRARPPFVLALFALAGCGAKTATVVLASGKPVGSIRPSGSLRGLGRLGGDAKSTVKPAAPPPAASAQPEPTSGFSLLAYDEHGRDVQVPAGQVAVVGKGDLFGIGGGLEEKAAKVDLAPGASARAAVTWRARGYNARPGASEESLAPGRYRLDLELPTLGREAKVAASATVTVVP
jgi:hypothetical protein